jgi:hypothetical protein
MHGPHREERRRPVEEGASPRLQGEEMGRREDPLVDEQVQAPTDQMGEEKEELPGDDTSSLRVDHVQTSGNYRIGSKSKQEHDNHHVATRLSIKHDMRVIFPNSNSRLGADKLCPSDTASLPRLRCREWRIGRHHRGNVREHRHLSNLLRGIVVFNELDHGQNYTLLNPVMGEGYMYQLLQAGIIRVTLSLNLVNKLPANDHKPKLNDNLGAIHLRLTWMQCCG